MNHLLLACPYARFCWNFIRANLNLSCPLPQELVDWFISWPVIKLQDFFGCIWQIAPSIVIWEIWKERNHKIFKELGMPRELLAKKIETSIVEVVNFAVRSSNVKNNVFTSWDSELTKNFVGLVVPKLMGSRRLEQLVDPRKGIKWTTPNPGWFKINFDGASSGNLGPSGIGCVEWDEQGLIIVERGNTLA